MDVVSQLFSLLLVVPDSPETQQPLCLFKGLLNALRRYRLLFSIEHLFCRYQWSTGSDYYSQIQIRSLVWLSTAAQSDYPYHIESVESNDSIYGGSELFRSVIIETATDVLNQLIDRLTKQQFDKRSSSVIDLFECVIEYGDISNTGNDDDNCMLRLAIHLWQMINFDRISTIDKNRLRFIVRRTQMIAEQRNDGGGSWRQLLNRMQQ